LIRSIDTCPALTTKITPSTNESSVVALFPPSNNGGASTRTTSKRCLSRVKNFDTRAKQAGLLRSKNGKPRTVPLNQDVIDILMQKSKVRSIKNDLVFTSSIGTKIDSDNLRRTLNSALKRAGIKDVTPHTLRHTFATRLAQRGVDIYKIAKLLGHKDIRMTLRYAHHSPDSLRDGVRILESDYNLTTVERKREVLNAGNP